MPARNVAIPRRDILSTVLTLLVLPGLYRMFHRKDADDTVPVEI